MPTRRPVDAADPARHVLLGLLLEGPSHGYDLARAFAPGTTLGGVVHLSPSHLYALLARLERDTLITGEQEAHGARPARRVYTLTSAGRETVQHWMDEPVPRPRDVLLDFPLKLYFASRLDPARAVRLIDSQRALFDTYLQELQAVATATTTDIPEGEDRVSISGDQDRGVRAPAAQARALQDYAAAAQPHARRDDAAAVQDAGVQFSALLRAGRISRTRATIQWLDHCAQVLATPSLGSTGPPMGGAPMAP